MFDDFRRRGGASVVCHGGPVAHQGSQQGPNSGPKIAKSFTRAVRGYRESVKNRRHIEIFARREAGNGARIRFKRGESS
jgi:hypothetical protein